MTLPLILARWVLSATLVHFRLLQQLLLYVNHDLAAQQTLHALLYLTESRENIDDETHGCACHKAHT